MNRYFLTFLLFSFSFFLCTAASAYPWSVKLRRSIINKNILEKPAQIQATFPDDADDSYSIDAGLNIISPGIKLNESVWEFVATGEWHRNTQTEKEQDSLIFSLSAIGVVGDISEKRWCLLPQGSLKYKNDRIKVNESILISIDSGAVFLPINLGKIVGPNELGFLWQPRIGLEYENIIEAKNENATGDVFRAFGAIDVAFYPWRNTLGERLVVSAIIKYWLEFSEDEAIDDGKNNYTFRKYSLRYYLNKKKNYAIAIERVDGSNPTESLTEQKFTQIAFQVKF